MPLDFHISPLASIIQGLHFVKRSIHMQPLECWQWAASNPILAALVYSGFEGNRLLPIPLWLLWSTAAPRATASNPILAALVYS